MPSVSFCRCYQMRAYLPTDCGDRHVPDARCRFQNSVLWYAQLLYHEPDPPGDCCKMVDGIKIRGKRRAFLPIHQKKPPLHYDYTAVKCTSTLLFQLFATVQNAVSGTIVFCGTRCSILKESPTYNNVTVCDRVIEEHRMTIQVFNTVKHVEDCARHSSTSTLSTLDATSQKYSCSCSCVS